MIHGAYQICCLGALGSIRSGASQGASGTECCFCREVGEEPHLCSCPQKCRPPEAHADFLSLKAVVSYGRRGRSPVLARTSSSFSSDLGANVSVTEVFASESDKKLQCLLAFQAKGERPRVSGQRMGEAPDHQADRCEFELRPPMSARTS